MPNVFSPSPMTSPYECKIHTILAWTKVVTRHTSCSKYTAYFSNRKIRLHWYTRVQRIGDGDIPLWRASSQCANRTLYRGRLEDKVCTFGGKRMKLKHRNILIHCIALYMRYEIWPIWKTWNFLYFDENLFRNLILKYIGKLAIHCIYLPRIQNETM
jgi:hypothetical protein